MLIGLIIYFNKPKWILLYWLSFMPIAFPVISHILPIGKDPESFYPFYNTPDRPFFLLFALLYYLEYSKGRISFRKNNIKRLRASEFGNRIKIKPLIISFLLISAYFVVRPFPHIKYFNIYYLLFLLLCGILFTKSRTFAVSTKSLFKFFNIVLVLQLIFSVFNLGGVLVYPATKQLLEGSDLICGTFVRYNHMTNYLTSAYLFISIEYFRHKSITASKYFIYTALIGLLVLISGAKMSVVLFGLILSYFVIFDFKNHPFRTISFAIILCAVGYLFSSRTSESAGFERTVEGMTAFAEASDDYSSSTVGLSLYLLMTQFDNPIFGNNLEPKGPSAYMLRDMDLQNFMSDAHLSFVLVDYGLVCLILYICFFVCLCVTVASSASLQRKNDVYFFLVYALLLSITELGLFDPVTVSFIFIFVFRNEAVLSLMKRNKRKRVDSCQQIL